MFVSICFISYIYSHFATILFNYFVCFSFLGYVRKSLVFVLENVIAAKAPKRTKALTIIVSVSVCKKCAF